jgi:hypothetical protein
MHQAQAAVLDALAGRDPDRAARARDELEERTPPEIAVLDQALWEAEATIIEAFIPFTEDFIDDKLSQDEWHAGLAEEKRMIALVREICRSLPLLDRAWPHLDDQARRDVVGRLTAEVSTADSAYAPFVRNGTATPSGARQPGRLRTPAAPAAPTPAPHRRRRSRSRAPLTPRSMP